MNPVEFCLLWQKIVVEITSTTINDLKCFDVNEVIVHPLGILQSFDICAKKKSDQDDNEWKYSTTYLYKYV